MMRRSGIGSGGGIGNNKVTHRNAPKVEPRSRALNPGGVNQLGNHVGDHVSHGRSSTGYKGEPLVRGPGYNVPRGPTSFNNVGPGGGRTIYKSGYQDQHGAPNRGNPPAQGRDTLAEFGPESK